MIKKPMDEVFLILGLDASTEKKKFKAMSKVLSHVVAKNLKIYTGGYTEESTVEETGGYVNTAIKEADYDNHRGDKRVEYYFKPDIKANLQLIPYIEPDTKKDYLRVKAKEFIYNEDTCYFVDTEKAISAFFFPYYYTYCEENEILNLKYKIDGNSLYERKSDYVSLPSYLDSESPLYAEELDLAIKLHKAIYEDGYKPHEKSLKQKIKFWLDNNATHLEYSEARNKRLRGILSIKNSKK